MTDTIHEQFARIAIAIGMEFDPPRDVADRAVWLLNKSHHDRERIAELETKIMRGIAIVSTAWAPSSEESNCAHE